MSLTAHAASLLPREGFGRNIAVLAAGTATAQLLAMAAAPVLARLYTPTDFGLLAAFASVVGLLHVLSMLAYPKAIPLPAKNEEALVLVFISTALIISAAATVAGGLLILGVDLPGKLLGVRFGALTWLIPPALLLAGMYEVLTMWCVRTNNFPALSKTKLSQGAGMVATQLTMGACGMGAFGLLVGDVIGRSCGLLSLGKMLRRDLAGFSIDRAKLLAGLRAYRRFPALQLPFTATNQVAQLAPALLIASIYTTADAGIFLLAQQVLQVPLAVVGRSVARAYFAEAAGLARTNPGHLSQLAKSTFVQLAGYGILPVLFAAAFGPMFFAMMFGEAWRESGHYVRMLAAPLFLQFAIAPLMQTLTVTGHQHWILVWGLLRLALIGGAFGIAAVSTASMAVAVVFFAVAIVAVYLIGLGILFLALRANPTPRPSARDA